jgi:hypothetical protein
MDATIKMPVGDHKVNSTIIDRKTSPSENSSTLDITIGIVHVIPTSIYIDPEKEKSVLNKFDKYVLPQAFLFILLNYLDRSNLGTLASSASKKMSV